MLSESLADWWDSEIWRHRGHGEYRDAVSPDVLLGPSPECIWPGLMNCDFLPLVSNNAGDWLCIRIDGEGRADQIVQWYHGAGDWIPWGADLPEALLLDALIDRLPGPSRRHAEPAENPRPASSLPQQDRFLTWACDHLPSQAREILDANLEGETLAKELLQSRLAEVAVRCELVVDQLTHPQRDQIQALLSHDVAPKSLAEWLFDVDRMPQDYRGRLQHEGLQLQGRQNWEIASQHARIVTELAPDLAWAWDLCGYAADRQGDVATAVEDYSQAAQCSVFTDQSIRLETHWTSDQAAKFSVSRLHQLRSDSVTQSEYFRTLMGPDLSQRRMKVTEYWLRKAADSEASGDVRQMHDCLTAAAWDVGVDSITAYATLLDAIAQAATQSDQAARAELAETHRRCLRDRYGL